VGCGVGLGVATVMESVLEKELPTSSTAAKSSTLVVAMGIC
jgi:hypothetical protein